MSGPKTSRAESRARTACWVAGLSESRKDSDSRKASCTRCCQRSSRATPSGSLAGADGVEGGAGLEPADLLGVEAVVQPDPLLTAVGVVEDGLHLLARLDGEDVHERDAVALADLLVVGGIREGEGKPALLLEVGLVDAGEGADDDRAGDQDRKSVV